MDREFRGAIAIEAQQYMALVAEFNRLHPPPDDTTLRQRLRRAIQIIWGGLVRSRCTVQGCTRAQLRQQVIIQGHIAERRLLWCRDHDPRWSA